MPMDHDMSLNQGSNWPTDSKKNIRKQWMKSGPFQPLSNKDHEYQEPSPVKKQLR